MLIFQYLGGFQADQTDVMSTGNLLMCPSEETTMNMKM
jgi:hypothetical protein